MLTRSPPPALPNHHRCWAGRRLTPAVQWTADKAARDAADTAPHASPVNVLNHARELPAQCSREPPQKASVLCLFRVSYQTPTSYSRSSQPKSQA
jgi:hypothetical protein